MKFIIKRKNWELILALVLIIAVGFLMPTKSIFQMFLSILLFIYWIIWIISIENFLWNVIDVRLKPNRIYYFVSLSVFILFSIYGFTVASFGIVFNIDADVESIIILLMLAFIFYVFYHVSTLIVEAEKDRKVSFRDLQIVFLFLIIFPLGFIFVQPRINKLLIKYSMN